MPFSCAGRITNKDKTELETMLLQVKGYARTCTCETPFAEGSCEPTARHDGTTAAAAGGPGSYPPCCGGCCG